MNAPLTHLLRLFLGHKLGPYRFESVRDFLPDLNVPNLGLYVHIPFCKEICPFCPYYKEPAESGRFPVYLDAIQREIDLVADRMGISCSRREISSLYVGGGSPATMIGDLGTIRRKIDRYFDIIGHAGIELHPRDIRPDTAGRLAGAGFDMVSIGVQSFSPALLKNLGRQGTGDLAALKTWEDAKFQALNIDLIFGIPGQTKSDMRDDFLRAVDWGATQISTYPFIDFSYCSNAIPPQGRRGQKQLLQALSAVVEETGFERTSVWTFGRKDAPRYSSVTRDNYIGFGPSATSLGRDAFKINTFSVDSYVDTLRQGQIPSALSMAFAPRLRKLYWIFWNCYNGLLSEELYRQLFAADLKRDFGLFLTLSRSLGLATRVPDGWAITSKGSYWYHRIEQLYTHQYIDKTWRSSMKTPWPDHIDLY